MKLIYGRNGVSGMAGNSKMQFTDEQRKAIQLKKRNLLVSASAGTGKTAVLTERIMELLLDSDNQTDIDEMVIVTFTRAAAAQMRDRIEGKLNERLALGKNTEHIKKQIALLPHAQITTIDSLCLNILREYFYIIDLDPAFRIGDDHEIKILARDVLEEIMEEKYTERSESFINMVETLAPKNDDRIIGEYVLKLFYNAESHPWPDKWLEDCQKAYDIDNPEDLDNSPWLNESGIIEHARITIEDSIKNLNKAIKICDNAAGYETIYELLVNEKADIEAFLADVSYTKLYESIGSYSFARFPSMRKDKDILGIKDEIKALRDYEKAQIDKLKKEYFKKSPKMVCEEIKNCRDTVNELISLTLLFRERFLAEKTELNVLDFNDIEHYALQIINNKESYAVNELRDSFRYILVDEYQDINDVQETIISSLSRIERGEYNLFMVGDVKQSIYGFRLAKPEIFESKRSSYTDYDSDCQRIMLKRNFRSSKAILGTVNYIFSNIMKKELGNVEFDSTHEFEFDIPKDSEEYGEPAEVIYISEGDTDITEYGRRKLEAAAIGKRIKELAEGGVSYDDIVILLRSMSGWAEEFVEMLSAMQIPVVAEEHTGYFSAREIRIAVSMLKIIDNPHQDIELVSVLRSVFGKFTDEELAIIRAHKRKCDMYTAFCVMADETAEKYSSLSKKCRNFNDKLVMLRKRAPYLRVYELIEIIYELDDFELHMQAMPMGERRLGNLRMLADQAIAFEGTDKRSLFDFLKYIDKMRTADVDFGESSAGAGAQGAVKIMSIHKSKGLEFPVVFVAGLGKQMNLSDAKKSVIIQSELGIGMDYFNRETRTRYKTLIKKAFARRIVNDSFGEELRVLYVALTRPKNRLIMTGVVSDIGSYFSKCEGNCNSGYSGMVSQTATYFDWLTPCFMRHPSWNGEYSKDYGIPPMAFKVYNADELIFKEAERLTDMGSLKERLVLDAANIISGDAVKDEVESIINYTYPYEKEKDIAVKVSVSDIGKHLQDNMDDEAVRAEWTEPEKTEYIPSFIKKEDVLITGAARGTLYHTLMQHLPVNKINTADDVREFLRKLSDNGIMPEKTITDNIISINKILKFCKSSIGRRMAAAQEKGLCHNEQPFVMGLSAQEVYPDVQSSEVVLVQGIIDVFFEEEDGIVLLDYKTDRIAPQEEDILKKRYHKQLEYYKKAIERVYNLPVKGMVLYSFAINKEIYL